jgi:hypothetical protein
MMDGIPSDDWGDRDADCGREQWARAYCATCASVIAHGVYDIGRIPDALGMLRTARAEHAATHPGHAVISHCSENVYVLTPRPTVYRRPRRIHDDELAAGRLL